MNIMEFIRITSFYWNPHGNFIRPKIVCRDGFSMSVQASEGHYSLPRKDGLLAYDSFECGYPSEIENALEKYSDGGSGIFGYVPASIVYQIITKHGGIDIPKTFTHAGMIKRRRDE